MWFGVGFRVEGLGFGDSKYRPPPASGIVRDPASMPGIHDPKIRDSGARGVSKAWDLPALLHMNLKSFMGLADYFELAL